MSMPRKKARAIGGRAFPLTITDLFQSEPKPKPATGFISAEFLITRLTLLGQGKYKC